MAMFKKEKKKGKKERMKAEICMELAKTENERN